MTEQGIGSRISELRQKKNMTQGELAGRIGVTPQALSKWERNQSVPDLFVLTDLCRILEVSADYLLGIRKERITENGDKKIQDEIWQRLQDCEEPLALMFGEELVPVFSDGAFLDKIVEVRKKLASAGILMPLIRVRDELKLGPREFEICSRGCTLYAENINCDEDINCDYIIERLEKTIESQYGEVLNRELVKSLTDNLKIKYPVLISETIPQRISYGLLTDILKQYLQKGNSIACLGRIIETLDRIFRENPDISTAEAVEKLEALMFITSQIDR